MIFKVILQCLDQAEMYKIHNNNKINTNSQKFLTGNKKVKNKLDKNENY